MSGPNPPGPDSPKPDEPAHEAPGADEPDSYSQAYSAPESEQFISGPYVPPDPALYDYDTYEPAVVDVDQDPPRWPWVVGVVAIVAAIALVVSVTLLVARTDSTDLANPGTSTTSSKPPVQDAITTTRTTTTTPPPPSSEPPPPPPPPRLAPDRHRPRRRPRRRRPPARNHPRHPRRHRRRHRARPRRGRGSSPTASPVPRRRWTGSRSPIPMPRDGSAPSRTCTFRGR